LEDRRLLAVTTGSVSVLAEPAAPGGGVPVAAIDGIVSPDEYGAALAVQDTPSGFGDEDGDFNRGSELDAAFAKVLADGSLQLALTGNLESNGNGIVIFIDSRAGGAVESILPGGYGLLGTFGGQRVDDWGTDIDQSEFETPTPGGASILDPGFDPDFAIEFNTNGGVRYVNVIDMTVDGNSPELMNRDVYLGSAFVGEGAVTQDYYRDGGLTFSGQLTHAFDNSNMAGVLRYDFDFPPGPLGNPLSAITGLELLLSPEFLDADANHEIKILPFITSGGGDFLSNQFLPGLGGVTNLGGAGGDGGVPLFDASLYSGDQFLVIPPHVAQPGDYNRDNDVGAADYVVWRKLYGATNVPVHALADGDGDKTIDNDDYTVWEENFGEALVGSGGSGELSVESGGLRAEGGEWRAEGGESGSGMYSLDQETRVQLALENSVISPILADVSVVPSPAQGKGSSHRASASHERPGYCSWGEGIIRDEAIGAWFGSYALERSRRAASVEDDLFRRASSEATHEAVSDDVDEVFELLSVGEV